METPNREPARHSAEVRMRLHLDGMELPIGEMGRDFLVLKTPMDHPPAVAEISICIDGQENRWRVRLAEGIQSGEWKTRIFPYPADGSDFNGSTAG